MNILALDLGTHTGYCHTSKAGGGLIAGTWHLAAKGEIETWGKTRMARRRDPRVCRLWDELKVVEPRPDLVVFEDVQFQTYTYQTQLWSSFRAAVWLAFPEKTVLECVPVTELKKFATGYGGATKESMATYLFRRYPEWKAVKMDDNTVDALWIYYWAQARLGRMKI